MNVNNNNIGNTNTFRNPQSNTCECESR